MLAQSATALPGDDWAYEPKWDGWRGVLTSGRLQSRHEKDLSHRFPELLGQVPDGTTLDGEVVCWQDGRLHFAGLQGRVRGGGANVAFVVFDVLEHQYDDQRGLPYQQRRLLLESLDLSPPLHLVESTASRQTALRWWDEYRLVGIEGLVAKRLSDPYRPGRRDWLKLRHRDTVELVVTGLIGSLHQPSGVVLGQALDAHQRHLAVSLPLQADIALEIAGSAEPLSDRPVTLAFGLPGQDPVSADPRQAEPRRRGPHRQHR